MTKADIIDDVIVLMILGEVVCCFGGIGQAAQSKTFWKKGPLNPWWFAQQVFLSAWFLLQTAVESQKPEGTGAVRFYLYLAAALLSLFSVISAYAKRSAKEDKG